MVLSFTGVEKTALWVGKDGSGGAGDVCHLRLSEVSNTKDTGVGNMERLELGIADWWSVALTDSG